ncbi:hypothetical protein CEUSTIGMA_g12895.t1 [Chlamydomonas eustigma]|uniref:Uncharacterized protein n=1 Tax=Chlamydomonas eustigma TaxID=1157962 RepID=A0A250XR96_9CHLO|nr:hypothetical protein CEUSTIGMA_g12895.t1 [Chlamydomonas eustigma]|eukprot:GAX85479.1 hypothetical protein CEUSTIGMA_g12895.t1 [Chlamydomonas eustigma]
MESSSLTLSQEQLEISDAYGSEFLSLDALVNYNVFRYDAGGQSVITSSYIIPALPLERDLYRGIYILTSTLHGLAKQFAISGVPIVLNVRFGLCNPVDAVILIDATSGLKPARNGRYPMCNLLRLQAVPLDATKQSREIWQFYSETEGDGHEDLATLGEVERKERSVNCKW